MRRIQIAAASLLALLAASGCTPREQEETSGVLTLEISGGEATKAVNPYTDTLPYETEVNSVQVLVFDADGRLGGYLDAGPAIRGISLRTTAGEKKVWAVVNGPDLSGVKTASELEGRAVTLDANSMDYKKGFLMTGSTTCTVKDGQTASASVTVSRLAARICLQKITNRLPDIYGPMTVKSIYLANVVGNQNLSGTAGASVWYNRAGRKDGAAGPSEIIDGTTCTATCPELTFRRIDAQISRGRTMTVGFTGLLYGHANSSSSEDAGWSVPFTPRKTRLVVTIAIDGRDYWYPVTIGAMDRNTTATVEMTVTGLGSDDPDIPISSVSAQFNVTAAPWSVQGNYDENI